MWFGERLKSLREEIGLSQLELGKKVGASRATISKYENNPEEIDVMQKLIDMSELFNVPVDYLLGLTDCKEKYPAPEPVKENQIEELIADLNDDAKKAAFDYLNNLVKKQPK